MEMWMIPVNKLCGKHKFMILTRIVRQDNPQRWIAFILKHSITETLAGLLTFSPTLLLIKNVSMQISILSANCFKSLISADHTAHFFSTWNFLLDNGPGNSDVWQQYANWMIDWNYFTIQLISMLANCWRSFHITLEKLIHWTPRPLLAFQT